MGKDFSSWTKRDFAIILYRAARLKGTSAALTLQGFLLYHSTHILRLSLAFADSSTPSYSLKGAYDDEERREKPGRKTCNMRKNMAAVIPLFCGASLLCELGVALLSGDS